MCLSVTGSDTHITHIIQLDSPKNLSGRYYYSYLCSPVLQQRKQPRKEDSQDSCCSLPLTKILIPPVYLFLFEYSCALLTGMQPGAATVVNSMKFPQKSQKYKYPVIQELHYWVFTQNMQKS